MPRINRFYFKVLQFVDTGIKVSQVIDKIETCKIIKQVTAK